MSSLSKTWLELFAGAGGATLGIESAGGEHVACIEKDPDACATLAAAGFPAVQMDVRDWTRRYREKSAWGSAHALTGCAMWASTPCQPWSSAGLRLGAADERNGWPITFEAIDAVRPVYFVGEQVTAAAQHSADHKDCAGCYLEGVVLPELRARFDHVAVWLLDAADFGVPQRRRRLFIVAGPERVRPPAPTHTGRQALGLFSTLQPWRTLRDALGLNTSAMTAGATGQGRPSGPDAPTGTVSTRGTLWFPELDRSATALEVAALQGFPPNYPWQGGETATHRQAGNAVPPALAAAVAGAVMAGRR